MGWNELAVAAFAVLGAGIAMIGGGFGPAIGQGYAAGEGR